MSTTSTLNLSNEYQKYFSTKLLQTAVQLTIMDQFALKQPLPKKKGASTISFFRRLKAQVASGTGLVTNVQSLTEGTPISQFTNATLDRVDVPLTQYGEATKVTDILSMTELFDALKQNIELLSEDCALNADTIVQKALVAATNAGVTLQQSNGSGGTTTSTEKIQQIYAQGLASFAALGSASQSGGKTVATDFLRAVTQLKINRAPTFGGFYVAAICPQVSADLQNDPDWIDAANWGDPGRRFKSEIKTFAGCRFVEHTNPFVEDTAGSEYSYQNGNSAAAKAYRTWVLGQGSYGVPAIEGDSPFNPRVMIVNTPDKSDPLNQYMTAGWKAFWAASALNCPFALSITSRSEFAV
jgi:N4-gp56 family major capsid protein